MDPKLAVPYACTTARAGRRVHFVRPRGAMHHAQRRLKIASPRWGSRGQSRRPMVARGSVSPRRALPLPAMPPTPSATVTLMDRYRNRLCRHQLPRAWSLSPGICFSRVASNDHVCMRSTSYIHTTSGRGRSRNPPRQGSHAAASHPCDSTHRCPVTQACIASQPPLPCAATRLGRHVGTQRACTTVSTLLHLFLRLPVVRGSGILAQPTPGLLQAAPGPPKRRSGYGYPYAAPRYLPF